METQQEYDSYKLFISNNVPEKLFIKKYGQELFNLLSNKSYIKSKGKCCACGHEPPDHRKKECLYFHIYNVNATNPELSEGTTLCKMCHATQHIENSVKNKWVSLVNSIYDQNNIIRLTRANQIYGAFMQRAIIELKKSPEQFLEECKFGKSSFTSTLKIIFTNNFYIDDLY